MFEARTDNVCQDEHEAPASIAPCEVHLASLSISSGSATSDVNAIALYINLSICIYELVYIGCHAQLSHD